MRRGGHAQKSGLGACTHTKSDQIACVNTKNEYVLGNLLECEWGGRKKNEQTRKIERAAEAKDKRMSNEIKEMDAKENERVIKFKRTSGM
eukprot:1150819-Pelagomonas_calceolata.AAC.4